MSPREKLEEAASKTGWNARSKLMICLRYIEAQNDDDTFADFVDQAVDVETENDLVASGKI